MRARPAIRRNRHEASIRILALGACGLALAACGGGDRPSDDVLGVARAEGLERFLRAVAAADMAGLLAGPGPYTVFAPSDAAFRAVPLRAGDRETMRVLVAGHVVHGVYDADFLTDIEANYLTLAGNALDVDGTAGLRVDGARVIRPDLAASNGVVHVIDAVLLPR